MGNKKKPIKANSSCHHSNTGQKASQHSSRLDKGSLSSSQKHRKSMKKHKSIRITSNKEAIECKQRSPSQLKVKDFKAQTKQVQGSHATQRSHTLSPDKPINSLQNLQFILNECNNIKSPQSRAVVANNQNLLEQQSATNNLQLEDKHNQNAYIYESIRNQSQTVHAQPLGTQHTYCQYKVTKNQTQHLTNQSHSLVQGGSPSFPRKSKNFIPFSVNAAKIYQQHPLNTKQNNNFGNKILTIQKVQMAGQHEPQNNGTGSSMMVVSNNSDNQNQHGAIQNIKQSNNNQQHQSSSRLVVSNQSNFHNMQQSQILQGMQSINGLLNMTKQRVLVGNKQQSQIRNSSGSTNTSSVKRSHSFQKYSTPSQLQTNGKLIAQNSPSLYTSSHLSQTTATSQHIQQLPLSVFDIQLYRSDSMLMKSNNKMMVKNTPQQNKGNGFSIITGGNRHGHYQQFVGSSIHQSQHIGNGQYIVQRGNRMGNGNGKLIGNQANYIFYDFPAAINGSKIGMPSPHTVTANYAISDPRILANFKKAGSAGYPNIHLQPPYILDQNLQRQLIIDYQALHNNELFKQTLLNDLVDSNGKSQAQLRHLQSQQLNQRNIYNQSMIYLPTKRTQDEAISPVRESIPQAVVPRKSKIPFANAYVEDCYKFVVIPGNNSGLIRKALERRDWWIEIPPVHSLYNFKWQPVSCGIKFERLSPMKPKHGEIGCIGLQYNPAQSQINENAQNQNAQENVTTRQMVNHFEFHHLISQKANLFHQLKQYCENQKENIFDMCPLTFFIEVSDVDKPQQYNQSLQQFIQVYQSLEENRNRIQDIEQMIQEYKSKLKDKDDHQKVDEEESDNQQTTSTGGEQTNSSATNTSVNKEKEFLASLNNKGVNQCTFLQNAKVTKFKTFQFEKRTYTKYTCPISHFQGYNLWLLKPTHLNRGRGIHVFRDLDDLHKLIKEYTQGKDEEIKGVKKSQNKNSTAKDANKVENNSQQLGDMSEDEQDLNDREDKVQEEPKEVKKRNSPKKNNCNGYKIKHNTFIIQKYIEKPLLLYGRKFDIRVWVLLSQDYDLYMFKEGYLRTSSSEFNINLNNVDDQYVHLTNNAVQKYSEHYGQFEDGNQLGYKRFQEILDEQFPAPGQKSCEISVKEHLVPQMKEQIIKSMVAVRKKIDPFRRKHCLELFGYDFILDADFNVWLIEINTNPCIEESSELLKVLLPRMIEDMLRLTIDQVFPKIKKSKARKSTGPCSPIKPTNKLNAKSKLETYQNQIDEQEKEQNLASSEIKEQPQTSNQDKEQSKKQQRIHPVPGYSNSENMWEKLWNLEKAEQPPNNHQNFRSEFCINIDNKKFKIKKNPLYQKIVKDLAQEYQQKKIE